MREVCVRDVWDIPGRWGANIRYVVAYIHRDNVVAEILVKEEGELAETTDRFCVIPTSRFIDTEADALEYSHAYTGELGEIPEHVLTSIGARLRVPVFGFMPAEQAEKKIAHMHDAGYEVIEDKNGKCEWRKIREGCPL